MVPKNYRSQRNHQAQINQSLENIYISPSTACNLNCHYCYVKRNQHRLTNRQILDFISRYSKYLTTIFPLSLKGELKGDLNLKSITFCGGELFFLPNFIDLINQLLSQHIFISIITNGTIDQLDQITDPRNCQLLVSFDGPKSIHDQNRGKGNFTKSKQFVRHALKLSFPVNIQFLVTQDSYPYLDQFKLFNLPITYLPDRTGSLSLAQFQFLRTHYPTHPTADFSCFQLSLQPNGSITACCESIRPLAKISDPIDQIIVKYTTCLLQALKSANK